MTAFVNRTVCPAPDVAGHAHLLVSETSGMVVMESPEAVMAEVEFRATHLSSLMEEMFQESTKHDSCEDVEW